MRLIGHLPDEKLAQRFADYMLVRDLETEVEPEGGKYAVWILDDEHIEEALQELESFRGAPDADRYHKAVESAAKRREKARKEIDAHSQRQFSRDSIWPRSVLARAGTCTLSLVSISVVVFLIMQINEDLVRKWLSIVDMDIYGDKVSFDRRFLYDVLHGQGWRLFTPMFIHFGFMHIFMNMILLVQLGGAIERRYGPWWTLLLVLVIAGFSNVLEYKYNSPMFGGMSGVVFGLIGFILAQSKYNPFWNFYIPPVLTGILLFWFVYCIVGLSAEVANFVHWGGLASGAVLGYVCAQYSIHRPNKNR